MNKYKRYYVFVLLDTLIASMYPLYMGISVVSDMIKDGTVLSTNYPKYIIPYTPISLALIVGVALMPVLIKYAKRFAMPAASAVSVGVFFLTELLLESKVIVTDTAKTTLESWQMYMCYVPPDTVKTRTWRAVDVLIGEYGPAFKIHFYVIAVVLILSFLNCCYGFARVVKEGSRQRLKALVLQGLSCGMLIGLCILACFTAFFRDGEITVSPVSAVLMGLFFVMFGLSIGIFAGSLLLGRK